MLSVTSTAAQVAQYLQRLAVDEALALLLRTNPPPRELAAFHTLAGCKLLRALKFDRALEHLRRGGVSPLAVLSLFPELLPLDALTQLFAQHARGRPAGGGGGGRRRRRRRDSCWS
jgi:hypothetical protein